MKKLFVLVRKDLNESYRFVQGTHAVAQWMLDYPNTWLNSTLVVLEVANSEQLEFFKKELQIREKKFSEFYEPDIGNQLTAIASFDDGKIFSKLKLA